jgi:hypothetical protein
MPLANAFVTDMRVFKKPGRAAAQRGDDEQARARLIAVFEACTACELAASLASDNLARREVARAGLTSCAVVCGETALALASLRVPDASRVRDELDACRAACALARAACEASDDAVARRCIAECLRVEDACDAIVSSRSRAA